MLKITAPTSLPRITAAESLSVLLAVGGPLIAKGVIIRRPLVVRLLQASGAEKTGIRVLQDLRRRYGDGPVMMRLPPLSLSMFTISASVVVFPDPVGPVRITSPAIPLASPSRTMRSRLASSRR